MELLDLPIEVFRLLLQQAVVTAGLCKGIKLRSVCKLFDREIPDAICSIRLLELYSGWPRSGVGIPLLAQYIFNRVMSDHTNSNSFSSVMHRTVQDLLVYKEKEEDRSYEERRIECTKKLCNLAASALQWSYRSHWELIAHLKPNPLFEQRQQEELWSPQNLPRHLLAAAAYLKKNETVLQLLSNKDINLHDDTYFGRFFECAARAGNNEILSRYSSASDINAYTSLYFTPLSLAASAGQASTITLLLLPQYNIVTTGARYENAIESAARNGHTGIAIQLVDHGTAQPSRKQKIVHSILCLACHHNHPELVLWALENGANINGRVKKTREEIPISWAAFRGHDDIVRLLLSKGANQHAFRPQQPLRVAVTNGYVSTALLLIDDHIAGHGGDYRTFFNEGHMSKHWIRPLFEAAAHHGHTHIIRLFVSLGFDLKRFPDVGIWALCEAAQEGHISAVRMLVEMGVDVNGERFNETPVVVAEEYGRDDMVVLLVELGAENLVERQKDGSKKFREEKLEDHSRIQVGSPKNFIVDYKRW